MAVCRPVQRVTLPPNMGLERRAYPLDEPAEVVVLVELGDELGRRDRRAALGQAVRPFAGV